MNRNKLTRKLIGNILTQDNERYKKQVETLMESEEKLKHENRILEITQTVNNFKNEEIKKHQLCERKLPLKDEELQERMNMKKYYENKVF